MNNIKPISHEVPRNATKGAWNPLELVSPISGAQAEAQGFFGCKWEKNKTYADTTTAIIIKLMTLSKIYHLISLCLLITKLRARYLLVALGKKYVYIYKYKFINI